MFYKSKLRGSYGRYYPIAILSCYISCIIEYLIRQSLREDGYEIPPVPFYSALAMAVFFVVMGIIQLLRYRLWVSLVLGILLGLGTFMSLGQYVFSFITVQMYLLNYIVLALYIVINWRTLYGQERYEAGARRLFKLSAELLYETSEGFTERPFSAGSISSNKDELMGFARFINGKYIGRTFYLENSIYIAFSMNKSVIKILHPNEVSYISIGKDGAVTVRISSEDYRQYRATFNFDQLCNSMGNVFKRFLEYYRNGNENRIITELKTAR